MSVYGVAIGSMGRVWSRVDFGLCQKRIRNNVKLDITIKYDKSGRIQVIWARFRSVSSFSKLLHVGIELGYLVGSGIVSSKCESIAC